jgi:hypothetical protein
MNPTCKDCGNEMKCGDCRYWFRELVDGNVKEMVDGECRVNPPQVLLVPMPTKIGLTPGLSINGFFPRTRPDLFCGKFMRLTVVGKRSTALDLKGVPWEHPLYASGAADPSLPDDGTP